MHILDINIQPGHAGRIIIRNSDGRPEYLFTDHDDLYNFVKRSSGTHKNVADELDAFGTALLNYKFVDTDLECCMKDIQCTMGPYSNDKLFKSKEDFDKWLNKVPTKVTKEVKKPMKAAEISKTVYIFAKEWDFRWSENEYLVAGRNFEYRDDLDELLTDIREADHIMIVPDDMIQDTARFVQVTGYDVHYEPGHNEVALNMSVTHAE